MEQCAVVAVNGAGVMSGSIMTNVMKIRLRSWLLGIGTLVCFVEVAHAPKDSDPGPWVAAVLGILLLRRAIMATPQSAVVILSGSVLATVVVAGDHGFLNVNNPLWFVIILVAGVCYAWWERIEKLWNRMSTDKSNRDTPKS